MELKHKWLFLVANSVALVVILFWLRENISLSEVFSQLGVIPLKALLIALILNVAVLVVYGMRLASLLAARRLPALAVVTIGFGMNGMLPFRLGEVAKLAYAKQLFGFATSRLIAATAVEKLMDLSALLILGAIASQLVVAPYLNKGIAVAALLVGVLVLLLFLAFWGLALWERSGRQTHSWFTDAFDTLRAQKDKTTIIWLASMTIVIWILTVLSVFWMFSLVFSDFSIFNAAILTLVLALAIAIPSAPAGLGVVEAAIVAYLHQALQVEPNQALASALAFHFIVVIPQIIAAAIIIMSSVIRGRIGHQL